MSEKNKAILKEANQAISAGNNKGFLSHCTEDTQWIFIGERMLHGKEAVRQWMITAYAEPPQFEVEHLIAEGDFVTAIGKITLKDENGEAASHDYCDAWRFHEGKMAELKAFVIKA